MNYTNKFVVWLQLHILSNLLSNLHVNTFWQNNLLGFLQVKMASVLKRFTQKVWNWHGMRLNRLVRTEEGTWAISDQQKIKPFGLVIRDGF